MKVSNHTAPGHFRFLAFLFQIQSETRSGTEEAWEELDGKMFHSFSQCQGKARTAEQP